MIAVTPNPERGRGARQRPISWSRRETNIKRAKTLAWFILFSIYLTLLYVGTSSILPSAANDANTIAEMSVSLDEVDSFDGYAAMALIYSLTNEMMRNAIIIIFSGLFIFNVLRWSRGIISISLASFLCFSPILLVLSLFIKDTFYLPFMMAALWILTQVRSSVAATIATATVIVIYALIFRQYFLIVAALFLGLVIFRKMSWAPRIVVLLAVPIILLFIPKELYVTLQEQRDIVNQLRVGFSGSGNRTVFLNYMRPDGLYSFLINYGYAFLRLNFPVFFGGGGAKEIFLMVNILLYGWLLWIAVRARDARIWRPALLFMAHFLTLMLFEPDLGSYLRHIGTSLPFLAPAFAILGQAKPSPKTKHPNRRRRPNRRENPSLTAVHSPASGSN